MRTNQPINPTEARAAETGSASGREPHPAELTREHVQAIVASAPVITVVGDIMLDCWLHGRSSRMAREAPVAVVEQGSEQLAPGGAANTAMNLAALGARVRLIGMIGDDDSGAALRDLLASADVDVSGLVESPHMTTTKKTRIVVEDHILLRLDCQTDIGAVVAADQSGLDEVGRRARNALESSDGLVIADYGGIVHAGELPERLAQVSRPRLIVVDAHEPAHWKALHPTVVTPNVSEAERIVGSSFDADPRRVELAQHFATAVREATNSDSAVITLDKDGTVAVDGADRTHLTTAHPAPERQTSGAGDTFVAGLTLALAAGLRLSQAAEFGQMTANIAIRKEGTSLCASDDLLQLIGGPRRTVLVLGHFDVLSTEDSAFLSSARRLGDYLVVAVDRDADEDSASLRARMQMLDAHSCVDLVAEYSSDAGDIVESLSPDVIAFDSSGGRPEVALPSTGEIPIVDVGSRSAERHSLMVAGST